MSLQQLSAELGRMGQQLQNISGGGGMGGFPGFPGMRRGPGGANQGIASLPLGIGMGMGMPVMGDTQPATPNYGMQVMGGPAAFPGMNMGTPSQSPADQVGVNPKNPFGNSSFGRLAGLAALRDRLGFNVGGYIEGPGTGTSDSIPAMIYQDGGPVQEARLSDGEFVMTERAVRGLGDGNRNKGAARMYELMNQYEAMA
jgi:hypothetical protein|tara:strand:- start:1808 stop:2404 length:597 start_codon:yes stop_codon:yes gene_type:complete